MKVHYGEGIATYTGPESCGCRREAVREALTGVLVGQPLSGEIRIVQSADALHSAEGNREVAATARPLPTLRRRRPRHASTPPVREPGGLQVARDGRVSGIMGKADGRSP